MKNKLFILLLILIFGSLFFNTSCRTIEEFIYNLNGSWWFDLNFYGGGFDTVQITCTGGVAYDDTYGAVGTYTEVGSSFNITIPWLDTICGSSTDIYTGTFTSVSSLSGTFIWQSAWCSADSGTFTATRL